MADGYSLSMPIDAVVIGQIARDLVLRIPETPEFGDSAPVRHRREMLGGKGANQAVGLAQLGMAVTLVGAVGDDRTGTEMVEQAERDGIDTGYVVRRDHAQTALIVDAVDDHARWYYLEDIPENMLLTAGDVAAADTAIRAAETVVVQLRQPAAAILEAVRLARVLDTRVVLDGTPPGDPDTRAEVLAGADVVRADAGEGEALAGFPITSVDEAVQVAGQLLEQGPELVVLEVHESGNVFVDADGPLFLPYADTTVVDTTGAGDALIAGLTATLTRGGGVEQAAQLAVAASEATIQHPGGRPDLASAGLHHRLDQLSSIKANS